MTTKEQAQQAQQQAAQQAREVAEECRSVPAVWAANISSVLFSSATIQARVCELARTISADYTRVLREQQQPSQQPPQPLLCVAILKGSCMFATDLVRHLTVPYEIDFLQAHSYSDTASTGSIQLDSDVRTSVTGRHVLVLEDLMDTGLTLDWVQQHLRKRNPASLRIAAMLNKEGRREPHIKLQLDYVGFQCPNLFVVGYGMDFNQHYRLLPFIGVLKPDAYRRRAAL